MSSTSPPPGDSGYTGTYSPSYYANGGKFNPTTAVVIIALLAGCFILAFVSVVVRKCMLGEAAVRQSSVGPQSASYNLKTRGLAKADVDALPLVHRADLGEKDDHECPVCLTDFEPEENLRLLPSCKHVFHQDCIDMWFDSHSTCPLCRASLLTGDAGANFPAPGVDQVAPGAPVESIYEVSENGDSDVEVHGGMRRDVPLEDSRTGRGAATQQASAVITREDERSSARGMLFRNSESFKRVARGVEAYESAAAEAAGAASEKNSTSFRKPPLASASVRRSSSRGADLASLRNLLMGADQNANTSSSRWFTRTKSLELASRDSAVQSGEPPRDEWVSIDLETGKATSEAEASTVSEGESSKISPAPERSWSDRFSLSSLKNLKGIAILSRSTSDVSLRHASRLPT